MTAVRKKTKLQAIDKGTRYDVTGMLTQLTREISRGEHGEIGDVVVLLLEKKNNCSPGIHMRHYGNGTMPDIHYMLSTAKNRVEPS
jgi:hypothetical protein